MRYSCALFFEVEADDPTEAARVCKQTAAGATRLGVRKLKISEIYDENQTEFDAEGYPA